MLYIVVSNRGISPRIGFINQEINMEAFVIAVNGVKPDSLGVLHIPSRTIGIACIHVSL